MKEKRSKLKENQKAPESELLIPDIETKQDRATTAARRKAKIQEQGEIDWDTVYIRRADLASFIGQLPAAVTNLTHSGTFKLSDNGLYLMKENLRGYIQKIRAFHSGEMRKKDTVAEETNLWKLEKVKQEVKSWRMNRDREIASAILMRMQSALMSLKDELQYVPNISGAIDKVLMEMDRVDPSEISYIVEGSDDEED